MIEEWSVDEGYYIVWLGPEVNPISDTWLDKASLDNAVRAAARKMLQSQYLVPKEAQGFCVLTPPEWRASKLASDPVLSKEEVDKLNDELTEKYGPRPPDDDDE